MEWWYRYTADHGWEKGVDLIAAANLPEDADATPAAIGYVLSANLGEIEYFSLWTSKKGFIVEIEMVCCIVVVIDDPPSLVRFMREIHPLLSTFKLIDDEAVIRAKQDIEDQRRTR